VPHVILGQTQEAKSIDVDYQNKNLFSSDIYDLKKAWQAPMKGVIA
jgi:hypothetical protein